MYVCVLPFSVGMAVPNRFINFEVTSGFWVPKFNYWPINSKKALKKRREKYFANLQNILKGNLAVNLKMGGSTAKNVLVYIT